MKKISSYIANRQAPSAGFSEGRLKDNPGDDSGSGLTVLTHNDFLYAFYAAIEKYRTGGISDTDESETQSDFVDALEEALGLKVAGVDAWSAAMNYTTIGASVIRHGMQFVCINGTGNLNKDPVTQPGHWMAVPRAAELFDHYSRGRVLRAECSGIHDYNGSLYRPYFKLGVHKVGGAGGAVFNAWGVHLDGATVTGASELDVILTGYEFQTTFAPGTPKVLKDARETVDRAQGATGALAPTIGARQEDQGQGWQLGATADATGARNLWAVASNRDNNNPQQATASHAPIIINTSSQGGANMLKNVADGVNGTPRNGSETRVKSFVTGVPYFVVMAEA